MRTPDSSAIAARSIKNRREKFLPGVLISFTTVNHPPRGFPERTRLIGLVELSSGKRVLAPLLPQGIEPEIGQEVTPHMILSRVNEQGLRLYDIAYALTTRVRSLQPVERRFPGYILALSGPAGVGKTTVSILLAKVMEEFVVKVPMVTTCAPREGEEGTRRYVSVKEFEHLKRTGDIVSWMRLPPALNEGFLGYLGSDITAIWSEGKIPLVATEMPLLQGLAVHFGRRTILSCGLLPPGQSKRARLSQLLHRLRTRGSETEDQIRLRLAHAERDLKVLDESRGLFDHILVNEDLDTVIATLKGHVLALVAA